MNQRNDKPKTKENGYSKEREGNGVAETGVEPRHLNVLCGLGLRIMQIFIINKSEINWEKKAIPKNQMETGTWI